MSEITKALEQIAPALNPFAGLSEGTVKTTAQSNMKIAIIGEQKIGKSRTAITGEPPVYHADFDGRKASIEHFINGKSVTYFDTNPDNPEALTKFEQDVAVFEYNFKQGKSIPRTFVLDSAQYLVKACHYQLFKQEPRLARKIKVGVQTVSIPAGFDAWTAPRQFIEHIISRFHAMGNVVVVFHARPEKDKTSTPDDPKYTGKLTVDPEFLAPLLATFNEVYFMELNNGKYTVRTKSDYSHRASTVLMIDEIEQPNIMQMLEKHKQRLAATKKG